MNKYKVNCIYVIISYELNMAASRALYITFSILYLISLAIILWFLLYYSGVPSWVWIFFGVAILIAIISLIIREVAIKSHVSSSGKIISNNLGLWGVFYILLQIMAIILIIVGLIFVIKYSTIPWWVWVILGSAILLALIGTIITSVGGVVVGIIFLIIAFIAYIVGIILLVVYSHAPWWIWILIGVMILFGILASIFEYMSEKPKVVIDDNGCITTETSPGKVSNCNITVKPSTSDNLPLLPTSNIPEQMIYK